MRAKVLVVVVVLAAVVQGVGFAQTETQTVDPAIEYDTLVEQVNSYLETGDYAAAIPLLKRMHELKPRELILVELLGILYINIPEERPELTNALYWLLEADKMHSSNSGVYYDLACVYSLKNDPEKAIMTMEKALALGYSNIEWMSQDEDLVNLRNTSWWMGIADNHVQIHNQLAAFSDFNDTEEETSVDEAIDFYSSIIASLTGLAPNIPALRCMPLSFLAYSFNSREDYALAIQHYLELSGIQGQVLGKDHPYYTIWLSNLGNLYYAIDDYAQAERYFLEALSIREKTLGKDHPDYASSLNDLRNYAARRDNLGNLYQQMGVYVDAELHYLDALNIREKVLGIDHPDYATSLNYLGGLYLNMGDYARAERNFLEALSIWERTFGKDHPDYAASLGNLGVFYHEMGDYAQAEHYFLEALRIYELAPDKDETDYVTLLNNLGSVYGTMGDYDQAAQYLLEAVAILREAPVEDQMSMIETLRSLGGLFHNMGNYAMAERCYLEALSIREEVVSIDLLDSATMEVINQLLSEFLDGFLHYAGLLSDLGAVYRDMGDYTQAERYYLEAINIEEKRLGKDHPEYISSLDNVYRLYLAIKEYNRAVPFKQEAYQLNTDQVNRNFSFLSEQQRIVYWNKNAGSFELTYSLSWHYPVPESNALNYDNALFSKGLLLRTTNAIRDSIYSSGDNALIAQFEELGRMRQQISALRQSGGNEAYTQSLEQQAEALDKSLTQSSAAFREFQADLALGWQDVRDSLRSNEAAIEFVSFRIYDQKWTNITQYAAMVLRPGMDAPAWVPLCEEGTLAELFGMLSKKEPQEQARILYDEHGPALYDAIWRPLESYLEGVTAVYYSPSGLLHKVAFSAVPAGNSRLIDVYDLNLVSSTREVAHRQSNAAQLPRSAVVYGGLLYDLNEERMRQEALAYQNQGTWISSTVPMNTTRGGTWNYLYHTSTESTSIYRQLTGGNISAVLYNAARGNKESFKSLDGKKTGILHLATHGFFLDDIAENHEERERLQRLGGGNSAVENPLMRSGLILAGGNNAWGGNPVEGIENGILFADDVARMNLLGTELVVLSACETGLGEVTNGEGVFGLQRAFKLAGTQTLVMSLWEVADRASSELMASFYQYWLSGMGKQEAFKEAQRQIRRRYPEPYFWAAFVMMD